MIYLAACVIGDLKKKELKNKKSWTQFACFTSTKKYQYWRAACVIDLAQVAALKETRVSKKKNAFKDPDAFCYRELKVYLLVDSCGP
jgi:hypothetical protein